MKLPLAMNIVILDDYQDVVRKLQCASKLDGLTAKVYTNTVKGTGQMAVRLRDAEAVVLIRERTSLNASLLDKLPNLRLVCQAGPLGSHIDIDACTQRGILVADGQGSPIAPAELTWSLVMAAARRLPQYIGNLKHGAWQQAGLKTSSLPVNFRVGTVLKGKTFGVWGYGAVGKLVAGYARAFGMHTIVWGSPESRQRARDDGFIPAPNKEVFFEACDVLSLHLRLTNETCSIIGSGDLARMKPTAVLINTSRAELIEENALVMALNRGRPGMVAVDVFENEPIMQGHPLLRLENAICTPHLGYVEQDSYEQQFSIAFDNLVNFIQGTPTNIVNPQALTMSPAKKRSISGK